MMKNEFPPASVIVNTYNRGNYLNDAISAIKGLDYPEFELIIVNGPSTDNSEEIISEWRESVKHLTCPVANLSVSRNIGIAGAAGELICFMDDDAAPHPQWLRRLAKNFRDTEVGGVGGFTIDNTGVRWQVRKTICDRYGNAHNVTQYFDERPLNRPGSPFYPSLLGTNSSFRADALRQIGGFDETFAYLLDETDVCLRLVDKGWKVIYEPSAIIYHQFAASHIRSNDRIARTIYPSAVSKSYFILRHGAKVNPEKAGHELERYRKEISQANAWLCDHGRINKEHRFSLDEDLYRGIALGRQQAASHSEKLTGDLADVAVTPFKKFNRTVRPRRVALVSRGFPPSNESGIARWSAMVAQGLIALGFQVHILTEALDGQEAVEFANGMWIHRLCPDNEQALQFSERFDIPPDLAAWSGRIWREVQYLKSFGLDIVSFPIWDLEGISLMDDATIIKVVSLHTTYAMAKPFKPEWNMRPLLEYHHVDRVIRAERNLLEASPILLANSQQILDAIESHYGLDVSDKSPIVPHGTFDPLISRRDAAERRCAQMREGAPLRVLYVGRFEERKGFDIALDVAKKLCTHSDIEIHFVGDVLTGSMQGAIKRQKRHLGVIEHERVIFHGKVDRGALDDLYVQSDLVLMPSRFESFGLVAIEALAAGRPVLALGSGGLADIATAENGCTSWPEQANVASLIANEILGLDRDRGEICRRGELARLAYERTYSIDAMARGISAIYERLIVQNEAVTERGIG